MKKKILFFVCAVSIVLNILQFISIEQQRLYNNKKFINNLSTLSDLFKAYPDGINLKDKQLQRLNSYISQMQITINNTSYKNKKSLSLMMQQLGQFLFMCSNEKLDKYIHQVSQNLYPIQNQLDDRSKIDDFNNFLLDVINKAPY